MLLFAVVNHGLYSQKYDFYYARWQQETKVESAIKGILVLMFLLLPIFIAIINIDIDVKWEIKTINSNLERFPENFMFQLTEKEVGNMVSQNAIPSKQHLSGSLPYAFTESTEFWCWQTSWKRAGHYDEHTYYWDLRKAKGDADNA